jgi:hypothetical protein
VNKITARKGTSKKFPACRAASCRIDEQYEEFEFVDPLELDPLWEEGRKIEDDLERSALEMLRHVHSNLDTLHNIPALLLTRTKRASLSMACRWAGISVATYRALQKQYPVLPDRGEGSAK